jgi:D-alanyl-D-alanine carboxypeptidase
VLQPELLIVCLPAVRDVGIFFAFTSSLRTDAAKAGTLLAHDVTGENPSWGWSAGAAIFTIEDLAKWAKALGAGELLDARWQQIRLDSIRPTVEDNPDAAGCGYGIARLGPLLGHTGELPGFNTFMRYDPTTRVTLVVWTNLNAAPDARMTPRSRHRPGSDQPALRR